MRTIVAGAAIALAVVLAFAFGRLSAQEGVASCRMCPSTYIPRSEIEVMQRGGFLQTFEVN